MEPLYNPYEKPVVHDQPYVRKGRRRKKKEESEPEPVSAPAPPLAAEPIAAASPPEPPAPSPPSPPPGFEGSGPPGFREDAEELPGDVAAELDRSIGQLAADGFDDWDSIQKPSFVEQAAAVEDDAGIPAEPAPTASGPLAAAIESFRSHRKKERDQAAEDAAAMGVEAVPTLIGALGDSDARVRQWSAIALEKIGPPALDAAPALEALLDDDKAGVRHAAQWALDRIKG